MYASTHRGIIRCRLRLRHNPQMGRGRLTICFAVSLYKIYSCQFFLRNKTALWGWLRHRDTRTEDYRKPVWKPSDVRSICAGSSPSSTRELEQAFSRRDRLPWSYDRTPFRSLDTHTVQCVCLLPWSYCSFNNISLSCQWISFTSDY